MSNVDIAADDIDALLHSRSAKISNSPSSDPKVPWSPASSIASRRPSGAVSGPRARRRAWKVPRRSPRSFCRATAFRRRASPTFTAGEFRCGLCARATIAAGRQSGWVGRRQRRRDLRDARVSHCDRARHARRQFRRRRPHHRDRGIPEGRRSQLHRSGQRSASHRARHLAGSQAPRRRRPGPEHRRHGSVFAGTHRHAGSCISASCAK